MKQNKETLDKHFRALKKGMNKTRDLDREKLTKLTLKSNECIKKCEKVEKVVSQVHVKRIGTWLQLSRPSPPRPKRSKTLGICIFRA